ncbi:hypothetical protein, partial [Gracilibacillus dipsosauri]|uniref:hypothetical protein n=1 Tax=Gracilibacillus dipsosauri TaxID=178340 RepID=UPI0032425B8A
MHLAVESSLVVYKKNWRGKLGLYLTHYFIGIIVLGIIASWIATWAWNQTSMRLTVSMAGMMIVFETLFG